MQPRFMVVMYRTKVYDIGIDHCLYWGMQHGYVYCWSIVYGLGLTLYNRPQLRMVLPFGISKFFDVVCTLWLDCIGVYHKYITLGVTNGERLHNVIEYLKRYIHSQPLSFIMVCIVAIRMNVYSYVQLWNTIKMLPRLHIYSFRYWRTIRLNHAYHEFL